jgi:BolA family transcriptional regulator, general stress-responsive regulator
MINYLEEIKAKIVKKVNPENITLLDNSHLHKKHKSFDPKKYHIKLIIESKKLKSMQKIQAHKVIFSILDEDMKTKIHALEILIE